MTGPAPPAAGVRRWPVTRTILAGGALVGVLDGLEPTIFWGLRGVPAARIFQGIAAGLLGSDAALAGGAVTAGLGALLHLLVATGVVAAYVIAARRLPDLVRRPLLWGPVHGVAVWLVMNLIVIPLSAIGPQSPRWPYVVHGLVVHVLLVGLPAALVARAGATARAPAARAAPAG